MDRSLEPCISLAWSHFMVTKILLLIPSHDGGVDQNGVGAFLGLV